MSIEAGDINVRLSGSCILNDISISVAGREIVGIIGPNGSGKSTLLKIIYRVLKPNSGSVMLDGKPLPAYSTRESAKRMAVVAQHTNVAFDFTVMEMVLMGRSPHKKPLERDNANDYRIAREALETVDMLGFEERVFSTLSGGERQRVLLAHALAQQTPCLILDEPTNHLDVKYQLQIMNIVKGLNLTVIAAIHDLNIAAMYCDRLYVMKSGRIVAEGSPKAVLTAQLIKDVYEVDAQIITENDGIYIRFIR